MLNCQRRFITKVRFAPSPTGRIHIGGLKTVLLNYLFAKSHSGQLIFRLEDTDKKRLVHSSMEHMLRVFSWFGIKFDAGVTQEGRIDERFVQSNRLDVYKRYVDALLASGRAYRCFCSRERLEVMRKERARRREPPGYDGSCLFLPSTELQRRIDRQEPFSVRLNESRSGRRSFEDLIHGHIDTESCIDYPILQKSDGFPTYHLANVVDDHEMGVTHVIRGQEWLASTSTHLTLYDALGWTPPVFGHVPLLLNAHGGKISKRLETPEDRIYDLEHLIVNKGFSADAVKVWLMSAGNGLDIPWSKDLTWDDVVQHFSVSHLARHSARLEQAQLQQTAHAYWQRLHMTQEYFTEVIMPFLDHHGQCNKLEYSKFEFIFSKVRHRIHCMADLLDYSYLWQPTHAHLDIGKEDTSQQRVMMHYLDNCLGRARTCQGGLYSELEKCYVGLLSKKQAFALLRTVLINKKEGQSIQEILDLMPPQDVIHQLELASRTLHEKIHRISVPSDTE